MLLIFTYARAVSAAHPPLTEAGALPVYPHGLFNNT